MDNETRLERIEAGACPHAILLAGAPESDWAGFARQAAARFLLHSDDVTALADSPFYLELSAYDMNTMRDMMALVNAEAFERGRRCIVMLHAETMSEGVQNVLLKTLEEPPADTLMILAGVESSILPTILSRCMVWRDEPEPRDVIEKRLIAAGVDPKTASHCAARSDGIYGRAKRFAEPEQLEFRKKAIETVQLYGKGIRPLSEAAAVCTQAEEDETGKKKMRVSAELTDRYFDVWLSLLHDALKMQIGYAQGNNTDCKPIVKNLADSFTTAQIQGMITTILEGKRQLTFRATASMTLDTVLCRLP